MAEYIEREKLIEHLKKDPLFDLVERYGITGVIESIPAADVRLVVRGKWLDVTWCGEDYLSCSMCGYGALAHERTNFCPNCGADMRERS